MQTIGRPDLATAPELSNDAGRVVRVAGIDAAIGAWSATKPVADVVAWSGA